MVGRLLHLWATNACSSGDYGCEAGNSATRGESANCESVYNQASEAAAGTRKYTIIGDVVGNLPGVIFIAGAV